MYGRASELIKLNADRNDTRLPKFVRGQADRAHHKITEQIKDKKLMRMREELINAAKAGDLYEQDKIAKKMKAYTQEDRETGL